MWKVLNWMSEKILLLLAARMLLPALKLTIQVTTALALTLIKLTLNTFAPSEKTDVEMSKTLNSTALAKTEHSRFKTYLSVKPVSSESKLSVALPHSNPLTLVDLPLNTLNSILMKLKRSPLKDKERLPMTPQRNLHHLCKDFPPEMLLSVDKSNSNNNNNKCKVE